MRMTFVTLLGLGLLLAVAGTAGEDHDREIKQWRSERVSRLTAPDGWLSLIGLHFLDPGESTVGSAPDNQVVLAGGPAHVGVVTVAASGAVRLLVTPGVAVMVNGEAVLSADLGDGRSSRLVTAVCGTVSFHVIDRGGKKALRVKDSGAERRSRFAGIDNFPTDPQWRIEADWVAFDRPHEVPIKNILGQESKALVLGQAVFTREGRTITLLPIQEAPDEPLFFIISDLTSGGATYGAARFLYADPPTAGKVMLDFNRAINPPCAFTPFATCPLPPKENQMPIAVTAGEKNYRGAHE